MELIVITEDKFREIVRDEIRRFQSPTKSDLPELLTRSQAANTLSVSPMTIDNFVKRGILDKVMLRNRSPRFKRDQILKLKLVKQK